MTLFLTLLCALIASLAKCQSVPFPSNGSDSMSSPYNPQPNGFLGFWTALTGGQRQCGGCSGGCSSCGCGGCGNGPSVNVVNNVNVGGINVNYNNNFYPGPVTENPNTVSTTGSTTTAPVCQVSIQGGPYYPSYCGPNYLYTSISMSNCNSATVTYLLSGLPCAYVQTDGTVIFDPLGCYVGQGVVYGTLTAVDLYTGWQYGSTQISVDTTGVQYCSTTTTTNSPVCTVTYPTYGSTYYPTECNQFILTPYVQGCAYSQVSYALTGTFPCVRVQTDGSVIIDLNGPYCSVGYGIINYGTLTATDGYTGSQLGSWYVTVDLSYLANCVATTTTSSTTTQAPCIKYLQIFWVHQLNQYELTILLISSSNTANIQDIALQERVYIPKLSLALFATASISFIPSQSLYSPVNCSQMLFYAVPSGCHTNDYYYANFQLTGFPPCLAQANYNARFGPTSFVFTPIQYNQQFVCDVGPGITYSGSLIATDNGVWPPVTLGTWDLTVDTSGLEHCVGSANGYIEPLYTYCSVDLVPRDYPTVTYRPTTCERNVLASCVYQPGCQYYQFDVRYALTGFASCNALQIVNGDLIFDVSNGLSCNITSGQYHTGALQIFTSFGDNVWTSIDLQLLTGGLQHCADIWAGATTTSLSVTP